MSDEAILTQGTRLTERLLHCSGLWVQAQASSLPQLSRRVLNDGSFFHRLDSPRGTTTATLERFAQFLSDPDNWPDAVVPDEICTFAHVVGVTSAACGASPDTNPAGIANSVSETEQGTPQAATDPVGCPEGRAPAAEMSPPAAGAIPCAASGR